MKVRRKSLWRSENVKRRFHFRANQRAAKERKRLERAAHEETMPDLSHVYVPRSKPSGFRIAITCLDDGEKTRFITLRDINGELIISPTLAGRKVAAVLSNYLPLSEYS